MNRKSWIVVSLCLIAFGIALNPRGRPVDYKSLPPLSEQYRSDGNPVAYSLPSSVCRPILPEEWWVVLLSVNFELAVGDQGVFQFGPDGDSLVLGVSDQFERLVLERRQSEVGSVATISVGRQSWTGQREILIAVSSQGLVEVFGWGIRTQSSVNFGSVDCTQLIVGGSQESGDLQGHASVSMKIFDTKADVLDLGNSYVEEPTPLRIRVGQILKYFGMFVVFYWAYGVAGGRGMRHRDGRRSV